MQVTAVTIDPEDDLVVLGSRSEDGDEDEDGDKDKDKDKDDEPATGEIEIVRIKGGRAVSGPTLPESSSDMMHRCASARASGLLAVQHWVERDRTRLVALSYGDPELAAIYSVPAPVDIVLTQ